MDVGNAWQKLHPESDTIAYLLSAPVVPFDLSGACPAGAYCPFVPACSYTNYTCPDYSLTGSAWGYKRNGSFWDQFAK